MKELPTFLRDTKHTPQIVENYNESILNGDTNLEGVVGLDYENMYDNMTENIGSCNNYLELFRRQDFIPGEDNLKNKPRAQRA
jgi:hypothetical protein